MNDRQRRAMFASLARAKARVKNLGFKTSDVSVENKNFVFRQKDSKQFNRFRTKDVGREGFVKLKLGIKTQGTRTRRDDVTQVQSVLVERRTA